ncbi:MAG: AAA family ATPase [Flavobacteriaceae bacterium]|nr:AAA family ATPase [Flavobacteriaceae bacterium]
MANIEQFKNFYLKVVFPINQSYEKFWNPENFDNRIAECISNFTSTFGKNFLEISPSEIENLNFNLEPFKSYSDKQGSGIPKSIIKHYRLFLEFDKKMMFNNLQDLINFVHQKFLKEKFYNNSYFIKVFQKERIRLNGNSRVAPLSKIFGDVREDYWTINIGAEREIQYHISIDDSKINYGLGFNAHSSRNNTDPLSCVQPLVDSFFRNEDIISKLLKGYQIESIKDKLKNIKVGDFCLLGKHIQINNLSNSFEIEGLELLEMLYDLANRQFEAYKIIFEDSINNLTINEMNNSHIKSKTNLLKYKKQIILQGPPGTGKTREAKQIAKALLNIAEDKNLKNSEQFQIIQFHPSYSYEDFVRGIVAKPNSNGDGITYEAENKILAKFAKRAFENYQNSQKDVQTLSKENKFLKYFEAFKDDLNDKIEEDNGLYLTGKIQLLPSGDSDAFRYTGEGEKWGNLRMLHKDILQAHFDGNTSRQDIKKNQNLSGLARQHASYYVRVLNLFQKFIEDSPNLIKEEKPENDLKNFVLIIDEINRANLSSVLGELIYALEYRGEAVDSMYAVDGSNKITLPPNLYIIGTMNTADRSVGHIDYAIRRRFAFVDVPPRDLSSELGENFNSEKFNAVADLFDKHLSQEFKKEEVQLGHSYFITENIDIQTRLEYEIKPILREYVKDGVLKELASDEIEKL